MILVGDMNESILRVYKFGVDLKKCVTLNVLVGENIGKSIFFW